MKKILSTAAAIALAASLISCGDSGDTYTNSANGAVDTVLLVSAPVVTKSVAYAGVNYIAWNPVAEAKKYDIYRTADGEANGTYLTSRTNAQGTALADIASTTNVLVDGVTYNYTIVAEVANGTSSTGTAIPSRSIYVRPNSTTTSVKAYVPNAGTKITDFTDLYTKNFISANYKDAAAAKKSVSINYVENELAGGSFVSSFKATAGYKFGLKLINATQLDSLRKSNVATAFVGNYLENYTANTSTATLAAGTYKAYLTIKSVSDYYPTPVVYEVGDVTVKALTTIAATSGITATYKDKETAVIRWTPAVLATGLAPTTNYKVYRTTGDLNDGSDVVAVTGEVKATDYYSNGDGNNTDKVVSAAGAVSGDDTITKQYYIEEKVPANNVKYTYFVVNTADGEYEAFISDAYQSATLNAYAQETTAIPSISGVAISKDKDNLYNVIKVTAKRANTKQTLALSYIQLDTAQPTIPTTSYDTYTKTLDTSKFTTVELKNNDQTEEQWISYVEKAANGTYLFKLTATESGKAPQSKYEVVFVTGATVNVSGVRIVAGGPVADHKAVVYDTYETADTLGSFAYRLIKVEETKSTTDLYSPYVTVSSTPSDITLKVDTVSTTDWIDTSKDYAKYGVPAAGTEGSNVKTYPYVIVSGIEAASASTGTTTTRTFSVQKLIKGSTTDYAYSDYNTNGKIVR